jgi:hypothetical protein
MERVKGVKGLGNNSFLISSSSSYRLFTISKNNYRYISAEAVFFNLHGGGGGGGGVQTGSTRHVGHLLAYCTCPGWLWGWRLWWTEWQGKPKYSEKTCPGATLSTTNPTWPDPGLNTGRRGGAEAVAPCNLDLSPEEGKFSVMTGFSPSFADFIVCEKHLWGYVTPWAGNVREANHLKTVK